MLAYWATSHTVRNWNDSMANEYRRAFEDWSAGRWEMAVEAAIQGGDYFPRISELRRCGKVDEIPETQEEGHVESCKHCALGRIRFGKFHKGLLYEKYLACDCAAGDRALAGMLMIAKRMNHSVDAISLRYSVNFADQGGLKTAEAGIGIGLVDAGVPNVKALG